MQYHRVGASSFVLITLMAGPAHGQTPVHPHDVIVRAGHEPIVEVHHEPHHRQVFQRGAIRILDLQIPPGDRSWFHRHEWPVFYLTLSRSAARMQNLGEEWSGGGARTAAAAARTEDASPQPSAAPGTAPSESPRPPSVASTTSYADRPIIHRLENVGERLFRAMVVVNETEGNDSRSVEAAGFDGTPELENRWFRAYRHTLAPGEVSGPHRHETPVVIFQASPGTGLGKGAMTFELNELGQWAYFEAGDPHELHNTGDQPLDLVEVEVRLPPGSE